MFGSADADIVDETWPQTDDEFEASFEPCEVDVQVGPEKLDTSFDYEEVMRPRSLSCPYTCAPAAGEDHSDAVDTAAASAGEPQFRDDYSACQV